MTEDVSRLLVRELQAFAREVELFPDDESLFRTLPGVTNSAGNLALHVCGNLQHFVGAVLGGSGYVRDREAEFGRRDATREELQREIAAAVEAVRSTLVKVDVATLERDYPLQVGGVTLPTGRFLVHLATHLAFHLGQAGYLRRVLTGNSATSDAVSLKVLA